jgi:hypothetical protein
MHYICIEDNQIISVLNYKPNVPNSITLVEISEEDNNSILAETHFFDVVTLRVTERNQSYLSDKKIAQENSERLAYLNKTDWMILRHIREKALGAETSLNENEYIKLEQKRNDIAAAIVKQDN